MQQASKYSDTQSVEKGIFKIFKPVVQRYADEGPGPEVPLAILQEELRYPQVWCLCLLPSLFSRSLMKGVAGHPPTEALGRDLLQWLKTVQLSSWVMGDAFFTLLQGHVGWGDRKRRADRTLEHWWSPGSHTKATPRELVQEGSGDDIPVQTHSVFWVSLSLPLRPHHLPLAFSGGAVRST